MIRAYGCDRETRVAHFLMLLVCLGAVTLSAGCRSSSWETPDLAIPHAEEPFTAAHPAEFWYATACRLEQLQDPGCVRAYYESAKASWPEASDAAYPASARLNRLYHSSVAKLVVLAHRLGQLEPHRLTLDRGGPDEAVIELKYHGFLWQAEDFNDFILVGSYSSDRLRNVYRTSGLGVPMIVKRKRSFPEPMRRSQQLFPATAALRPDPTGTGEFALEFFDPVRIKALRIDAQQVSLCRDLSAPFAYRLQESDRGPLESFLTPNRGSTTAGLYALEPHQPGKIPVIFVHGLLSDPTTWATVANELRGSIQIRDRYQLWAFEYPTGDPFIVSAARLRRELAEAIQALDPEGKDPALRQAVMVGHSMGGLLTKLQVTDSGTRLWDAAANRPFDQIVGDPQGLTRLAEAFFFERQPAIQRVIFVGTPHRGAATAQRLVGRVSSSLVREPPERVARHAMLIASNPGVFSAELERRIPTSIDLLEPRSPLLQAVAGLAIPADVVVHSIIGDRGNLIGPPSDGVVPVHSARHPGASSERMIRESHTQLHGSPLGIQEIFRILDEHWEQHR